MYDYFIYTYIISLLTGRYELNKLTSLPMCGFIAQLVGHRTGIAEVTGSNPVEALIFFFQASSFQLLKLENSLRGSFFTFIYNRSSKMYDYFIYTYITDELSPKCFRGFRETGPRSCSGIAVWELSPDVAPFSLGPLSTVVGSHGSR